MGAIRAIQDYLCAKADKAALPRVENTNVDRSVGLIHMAVMGWVPGAGWGMSPFKGLRWRPDSKTPGGCTESGGQPMLLVGAWAAPPPLSPPAPTPG